MIAQFAVGGNDEENDHFHLPRKLAWILSHFYLFKLFSRQITRCMAAKKMKEGHVKPRK